MSEPTYAQLIAVLENSATVGSIGLTEKRIDVLLRALRVADAGLVDAMQGLLNYTGGWDLPLHGDHPISKARAALFRAQMLDTQLLTEHPPCEMIAKAFDLKTLTEQERRKLALVIEADSMGLHMDGNRFGAVERVLVNSGLVTKMELTDVNAGTWVLHATAKGKAAK